MSLVSGFAHPHMMHHHHHHHDGHAHHLSVHAHHEDSAPPYFTSWLISHADMSPSDYSLAPGYSPEYHQDHLHHHHHHYGSAPAVHAHTHPRTVKRRPTANRKERRRTQSINSAFAELRECIPNVPADTKLSKIKTLRLATSYISYLMDILDKDQAGDTQGFKAELKSSEGREERRRREVELPKTSSSSTSSSSSADKKSKGRTGWPQHVWALELKQ